MDVQAMSESLNVLDLKDKTADYKKLIDYYLQPTYRKYDAFNI